MAVGLSRPTFERDVVGILSVGGGAADRAARPAHPSRVVRCTRKWVARHLNKSIRYLGPCPKSPIFAVAVLRIAPRSEQVTGGVWSGLGRP